MPLGKEGPAGRGVFWLEQWPPAVVSPGWPSADTRADGGTQTRAPPQPQWWQPTQVASFMEQAPV